MSKQRTIKWGIVGCGKIAHKFAQDLMTVPGAIVYGVASRDLQKATDFGKKYNALYYYGSYEELAKNLEIDVVYIATPHVFHYENTLLCLQHQKAVLCEKPLGMHLHQVQEMIACAKKNNVFLMEALWTYFLPHYIYVLKLIESKEMGAIKSLKADFGFKAPPVLEGRLFNKKLGGGSLLDIGIYPLFASLSILGYPKTINASATIGTTGVDESCSIFLEYDQGITASLYSTITKKTNTEAIIEMEKGTIHINSQFYAPSSVTIYKNGKPEPKHFSVETNGYNYEAIHVQEMLYANKTESTIMTFNKSIQLIQLLDAVREKIGLVYL